MAGGKFKSGTGGKTMTGAKPPVVGGAKKGKVKLPQTRMSRAK